MKYPKFLGVLIALAVTLSACSTSASVNNNPVTINTLPPVATKPRSTVAPEATAISPAPATASSPVATSTAMLPVTAADCTKVTVQAASLGAAGPGGTSAGPTATAEVMATPTAATSTSATAIPVITPPAPTAYLVDCNGMTLYAYIGDTPNSGISTCTAACAAQWPALTVDKGSTPMVGNGLQSVLLFNITRADGAVQVTYNGWPLYLYKGDHAPGDKTGVGVAGKWFLIAPTGDPIER